MWLTLLLSSVVRTNNYTHYQWQIIVWTRFKWAHEPKQNRIDHVLILRLYLWNWFTWTKQIKTQDDRIGNLSKCTSLLPPANEVWGKIIFSQASVILSTGRGVDTPQHYGIRSTSGRYASYWNAFLLPPANEVWGKVIFLHQFVILFTGRGHAWLLRGVCVVAQGGMLGCSGGVHGFMGGVWFYSRVCVVFLGGHVWFYLGGMYGFIRGTCVVFSVFSDTMRYGQWAGGTHPTGMHSCYDILLEATTWLKITRRLDVIFNIYYLSW